MVFIFGVIVFEYRNIAGIKSHSERVMFWGEGEYTLRWSNTIADIFLNSNVNTNSQCSHKIYKRMFY